MSVRYRANNKKYTYDEVRQILENNGYFLLDDEYIDSKTYLNIFDKSDYKYYIPFIRFIDYVVKKNYGIEKFSVSNPHTIDNIKNWIKINGKSYSLLDGQVYVGSHQKLKFKCTNCHPDENPFESCFTRLKSLKGCPICASKQLGKFNNLDYLFPDISNEWNYEENCPMTPKDFMAHSNKKVSWVCPICKFFYRMSISKRTSSEKRGCPQCNESNMERIIRKFLENSFVKFVPQKIFKDCRDIKPLEFDFYLKDYNVLIEAQGVQHTQPVIHFGGDQAFLDRKKKDKIKKDYCIEHGIKLLEIHYWEFKNIESILSKELNLNFSEHEICAERKEN